MKTRNYLLACIIACFSISAHAQLTVDEIGRTQIGPTNDPNMVDNDKDNITSLQVFGRGYYQTGALISIGDIGKKSLQGFTVTLGEWGGAGNDSDILWLHGKKGMYLTSNGSGTNTVAYYDLNQGNAFRFNCPVYANGVLLTSDERYKSNIEKISSSLSKLNKLEGVQYNLNANQTQMEEIQRALKTTPTTEKEKADKVFFEELEKKLAEEQNKKHIGFVAQDIQKVFPELVRADKDGYLAVDYIGLIPVLVEGLKELQGVIVKQEERIQALERAVGISDGKISLKSGQETGSELIDETEEYLSQNIPNPVNGSAQISYSLPDGTSSASIVFYSINGTLVKNIPLNTNDKKGIIVISSSDFTSGLHVYNLVVNGITLDSKKMISK